MKTMELQITKILESNHNPNHAKHTRQLPEQLHGAEMIKAPKTPNSIQIKQNTQKKFKSELARVQNTEIHAQIHMRDNMRVQPMRKSRTCFFILRWRRSCPPWQTRYQEREMKREIDGQSDISVRIYIYIY